MPLLLILAAAVATQSAPGATPLPSPVHRGSGRTFMSPMGEPFFGSGAGGDGLSTWFEQADTNHDGSIAPDEMAADAVRFFGRLDTNKDGEIDPDEINVYEQTMLAKGYRYGLLNIPEPVMSADGDFNRGVSLEEFRRAATKRFQLLDLNHSGRLTLPVLLTDADAAADQAKRPLGYKPPAVQLDPQADTESATPQ